MACDQCGVWLVTVTQLVFIDLQNEREFCNSFVIYHQVAKVIFNLGSGMGVIRAPSGEAAFVFGG